MTWHRHKFNAVAVGHDGYRFDSKAEGRYYEELKLRCLPGGDVLFFLRQVPFFIAAPSTHAKSKPLKYVVDFLEFHRDGTVHFVDVKGMETKEFKIKKRLVEAQYPVKIELVK